VSCATGSTPKAKWFRVEVDDVGFVEGTRSGFQGNKGFEAWTTIQKIHNQLPQIVSLPNERTLSKYTVYG
jgi:hypothetical protein